MAVTPGATPTAVNLNSTDPAIPEGKSAVTFQASDPYPDPNDTSRSVRDVSAYTAGITRTVGITIEGVSGAAITPGVKGGIQVDFEGGGTIIGWSILETSGHPGDIQIEVDKHAGTQTVPVIPNTTSDKISASAPIALSSSDAAGVGPAGVSTWSPLAVAQWDSIQFYVASASTVQRVTVYLRIQGS